MPGGYFDISDILAEEERVPVTFSTRAQDLGYLVEGSQDRDVDLGTQVELPYWLAEPLAVKRCVAFETPHYYLVKHRNSVLADARHADLRNSCEVFYQLGMKVAPWLASSKDERTELAEDLVKALTERFDSIMDHSQNSLNDDNTKFTNILSATELQLYWDGYASARDFLRWKHSRGQKIAHSWLVELHDRRRGNKRRRSG